MHPLFWICLVKENNNYRQPNSQGNQLLVLSVHERVNYGTPSIFELNCTDAQCWYCYQQ